MGIDVDHRSFVIERDLPGRPGHAWRFWSDHQLKRRWNACHPDWVVQEDWFDFRIDGSERMVWIMPDGTEQAMVATILDLRPRERIVYAYAMRTNGVSISASLVTVEFIGHGDGTRMVFTEQAMFDNSVDGDIRQNGTGIGFTRLQQAMADLVDSTDP